MNKIDCNGRLIGRGEPAFIIAEIGQAHEGSLGMAHSYIDAVASTGVDAIKFQTHIAVEESSIHDQFRVNIFPQDKTRFDYWKRMEFSEDQWRGLSEHARDVNLEFLSTPFSIKAVEILSKLNVPMWKIGSGDIAFKGLVGAVANTKKPVLLSSGMSNWDELDKAVDMLEKQKSPYALFQCTTSYPCKAEDVGYNIIDEMISRYQCPVGLSDHSGTIFPSLASIALGANLIEVHAVFSKQSFGPDSKSSLTIDELKKMVEGVRFIESGLNSHISKDNAAENRENTKSLFARSAFYKISAKKGTILTSKDIAMKKPGGMLDEKKVECFFGKKLNKNCNIGDYVKETDFE